LYCDEILARLKPNLNDTLSLRNVDSITAVLLVLAGANRLLSLLTTFGVLYSLSASDEMTTETDDKAIAKPANAGGNVLRMMGKKTPAAIGMPKLLQLSREHVSHGTTVRRSIGSCKAKHRMLR
jgi:hypothetical protein